MDFAWQREMAGLGVGVLMVEVLNGPINGNDCLVMMIVLTKNCWAL